MPSGKVTAFRLTDEELELLDVIQGQTGIRSRMEALRTVLRYYAESNGIETGKAEKAETSHKRRA
jgi:hypothetical protein